MPDITCSRCGQTREGLSAPPFPTELGARIQSSICQPCWKEWLQQQTAIINHYALDLRDPKARQMLTQQTETFLFGATAKQDG
jgi:Fe-S cluster biosynthesis and repair protein YggX